MSTKSVKRNRQRKLNKKVRKAIVGSHTKNHAISAVSGIRALRKLNGGKIYELVSRLADPNLPLNEMEILKRRGKFSDEDIRTFYLESGSKLQTLKAIKSILDIGLREAKALMDAALA